MLKSIVLMLSIFAMAVCVPASQAKEYPPQLVAGRYLIDVRTQDEFDLDHIEGAILISHDRIGARIASVLPDRKAPIALYCGTGRRAGMALATLQAMGYTHVENLGGIDDARRKLK
jgi:phage shock protein E